MSLGIKYAQQFNDALKRSNREAMNRNELAMLAQIDSADHVCTLLAYGQCNKCKSYISLRYGRFCIISIDNLLFDYMSEIRAASTVANAFNSSHHVNAPEIAKPGNPQRISTRDIDLKKITELSQSPFTQGVTHLQCDREHLTDHTCPTCPLEHTVDHKCPECPKKHLDTHTCKPCDLQHLDAHKCKPCEEKHLRDHKCPPCKEKHLADHVCPKCKETHLKDHTCKPCQERHLKDHKCPTCTRPHLDTHKCPTCDRPHLDRHRCPPCQEDHLKDHTCQPCSKTHLDEFPAYLDSQVITSSSTIGIKPNNESTETVSTASTLRRSKKTDLSNTPRGRQLDAIPIAPFDNEHQPRQYERKQRLPLAEAPVEATRSTYDRDDNEPSEPYSKSEHDEVSISSSTRRHHRREESVKPKTKSHRTSSRAPAQRANPLSTFFGMSDAPRPPRKSRREDQPPSPTDERKHRRHDSHLSTQ